MAGEGTILMGKFARLLGGDPDYPDHLIALQITVVLSVLIWPWLLTLSIAFCFCFSVSLFVHMLGRDEIFFDSPVFAGLLHTYVAVMFIAGVYALPFILYETMWPPLRQKICALHPACESLYFASDSSPPDGVEAC